MKNLIRIASFSIQKGRKSFVIAEAGVNHNGKLDLALRLIEKAADARADAIKFQTFRASDVTTKHAGLAPYQTENIRRNLSQQQMLKELELREDWYPILLDACKKRGIIFLSTPHSNFMAVDFLTKLNVPGYKIASPDITNLPFLDYVARQQKPILLSTGSANGEEVAKAVETILETGNEGIVILHCTSSYPCPMEEVNFRAMQSLMRIYPLVGYSDHTEGTQVSLWAALLDAVIIEKHFTLDRKLPGPDQKNSIEPQELEAFISELVRLQNLSQKNRNELINRIPDIVMGSATKQPTASEKNIMAYTRKSLVWNKSLDKGHIISISEDIVMKRPGTGLPPKLYYTLQGKRLARNVTADTLIQAEDFV